MQISLKSVWTLWEVRATRTHCTVLPHGIKEHIQKFVFIMQNAAQHRKLNNNSCLGRSEYHSNLKATVVSNCIDLKSFWNFLKYLRTKSNIQNFMSKYISDVMVHFTFSRLLNSENSIYVQNEREHLANIIVA